MAAAVLRGAALVLLTAGGFGVGTLLGPDPLPDSRSESPPRTRRPSEFGQAPRLEATPARVAPPPASPPAAAAPDAEPVPRGPSPVTAETLPRVPPQVDRGGAAWRPDRYGQEAWLAYQNVVTGAPGESNDAPFAKALGRFQELWLRNARTTLEIDRRAGGPPPWSQTEFRAFGTFGCNPNLLQEGRDFLADASPEASLAWYEARHGHTLVEADRESALRLLRTYETDRRAALARLAQMILTAPPAGGSAGPRGAFLVRGDGFYWVSADASAEVATLLNEHEALQKENERRMLDVLGVAR